MLSLNQTSQQLQIAVNSEKETGLKCVKTVNINKISTAYKLECYSVYYK